MGVAVMLGRRFNLLADADDQNCLGVMPVALVLRQVTLS